MPVLGITGSVDGIVPNYDPEARWCVWGLHEIFTGTIGLNRFVPKVNDYVVNYVTNEWYKVTYVNSDTLISVMVPVSFSNQGPNPTLDPLLFITNNADYNTYKCYFDDSVVPHLLTVDQRAFVGGSMVEYAKIFKGTDTTSSGEVIAFTMTPSGTFLTQNIEMENVALNLIDNHHIKIAKQAFTRQKLKNGEYLTICYYSANGHIVEYRKLIVEETSTIRDINVSQRHVTNISLESTFLSPVNNSLLEFPINVPISSFNMIGVIHYSDGQTTRLPVDNTKFRILGLEKFVSTEIGQRCKLKLSYALANDEVCYNAVSSDGKYVVANYELVVTELIGSYSVKLIPVPRWLNDTIGYTLSWYLVNLDRNLLFDVTALVTNNLNSPIFAGKNYGIKQNLSVRINLRDVSVIFRNYIHVQNIEITLVNPIQDRISNWLIAFEPNQYPRYGAGNFVKSTNITATSSKIKVDSLYSNQEDWLRAFYLNTKPLMDSKRETSPPRPTHFEIMISNDNYRFPISAWNNELTIGRNIAVNSTLVMKFIRESANGDLILSVSGIPVYEY